MLLLDEPFSALDLLARAVVDELVGCLRGSVTILIVTHSRAQTRRLAAAAAAYLSGARG